MVSDIRFGVRIRVRSCVAPELAFELISDRLSQVVVDAKLLI